MICKACGNKFASSNFAEALTRPLELDEWLSIYADYLLANGVIVLPCKVGDRVYSINIGDEKTLKIWIEPSGDRITQIKINRGGYHFKCWWGYFHLSDIGKTVFLTKEEAEKALKERERKEDDNG